MFLVEVGRNRSINNCGSWKSVDPLTHPLSVQEYRNPVEAPSRSRSCIRFRANVRKGGIITPAAF